MQEVDPQSVDEEIRKLQYKKDLKEVAGFANPPRACADCAIAVAKILGLKNPDWKSCQVLLKDKNLPSNLLSFDKTKVSAKQLATIRQVTR